MKVIAQTAERLVYDARYGIGDYAGMFHSMDGAPLPTYYSFKAFGELYHRGIEVYTSEMPENTYAMAAKGTDGAILLVNTTDRELPLQLELKDSAVTSCKVIREGAVWEEASFENTLPAESVTLIYCNL